MNPKIRLLFFLFFTPFIARSQNDTIPEVNQLLDLSLEQLMNIRVVTASGYLQTVAEAPSTITVITSKQIQERGYEQLEDALRDVPGIDMIHINGYAPTLFYFRGMYGAENLRALLMIDGVPENNIIGSNDMAGPVYSLHNIERVEIVWGAISALYGANAFGGVINMITKKGADINGFNFDQGFGSFNTNFKKLSLGLKKNKLEFSAAGTLYSTDGPRFHNRDPIYSASFVDNAYSFNTAISYYAKKSTITMGYRNYHTVTGWGTYSNSPTVYLHLPPQGNGNIGLVGLLQRDFRNERPGVIISFLRTWFLQNEYRASEKLKLLARLVYRETGTGDDSYLYVTADGNRMIRAKVATYSNRVAGELTANYNISDKHKIFAGVGFNQDNVEEGGRATTFDLTTIYLVDGRDTVVNLSSVFRPRRSDIRNNIGGYLQYVLSSSLFKKTEFTFGARYDHHSYFGSTFNPRISIVNNPSSRWTFKFQFGTAFRAPTNLEVYQTPGGNFQIKPERIKTFEINAIYLPRNNLRFQLNGYRNELTDVVILSNLSGLTVNKNPGVFTIHGVEAIADFDITKTISGFVNFTFTDTWGKNLLTGDSGRLPGIAAVKGNAGLTFRSTDFLTISLSGNWVGERRSPRTSPYGPVDGYFLTNCSVTTARLFKDRVTASLNIHNLFNVRWLDPGFRTADGLLYATVLEQPGINAVFKIGIRL